LNGQDRENGRGNKGDGRQRRGETREIGDKGEGRKGRKEERKNGGEGRGR
jgi:hypothetical protein